MERKPTYVLRAVVLTPAPTTVSRRMFCSCQRASWHERIVEAIRINAVRTRQRQGSGRILSMLTLVPQLLAVHCATGVPLSMYWRRSGNLLVTGSTHAMIDAARNALLILPWH